MANQIRLKRSAVQGKAPVVGDLELGELAVNTYDGKLYMKKNDGADAIVEITAAGGYTDPLTTNGDIVIRSGGTTTRLGIGSEGQALLVSSGLPAWGNVAGGYTDPLTTDGDIVIRSGGSTTRLGIGSEGQVLKVSSGLPVWAADAGGLADVVDDTTPQLGGNLDVNGNYIVSASGGDVVIAPDTTGGFVVRGNNTDGSITLNCTANTHGVTIQSPPHAAAATYTLILPNNTGTSGQVLSTNGTGTLSWLTATQPGDNISTLTNDSGYITTGSTTSDAAPSTPSDGDLWYRSSDGRMYVYYDDGNSQQWVDANPNLPPDPDTFDRSGTTVSLVNSGDTVSLDGDLTVDTNTLYVDSTNNRVGIGSSSPGSKLHIEGTTGSDSRIHIESTSSGQQTFDGSGSGLLLTAGGMNPTNKFTPAIQFGSTDSNFTTTNPKICAAINAIASSTYNDDADGGMNLAFYTTSGNPGTGQTTTERMRISAGGDVGIDVTSPQVKLDVNGEVRASTGVLFGTDTAAENTLDDYEEGTWTPVYEGNSSNPTITYSIQAGVYTKIGNTVHCQGRLQTSAASGGSGSLLIGNFPFTSKSGNERGIVNIGFSDDWLTQAPETGAMGNGSNTAFLRYHNGANTTTLATTDLRNVAAGDNDIIFDVTYEVA